MRYVVALSALILAGCIPARQSTPMATQPEVPTAKLVTADKAYVLASLNKLRNSLKDPDSARIYGVYATQKDSQSKPNVCGLVNAKNSYGGYTGKKRFLATPNIVSIDGASSYRGVSVDTMVIEGNCRLAEGQPPPPDVDGEFKF